MNLRQNKSLPNIFNALGDQTRFKIFKILLRQKDICVSEIAAILKVSVPAVSQHLKILENAQLLIRERKGQSICYQVNAQNRFTKLITKMVE